jgi:hypothetical protein
MLGIRAKEVLQLLAKEATGERQSTEGQVEILAA